MAYERRTATPIEKEAIKRKLFKEKDQERVLEGTSKKEIEKGHQTSSEVRSSNRDRSQLRGLAISMFDLPKYDGTKDPQEHLATFNLVMNLYGHIESHEQLVQKFTFHFASKRKEKRSATHLFTIRHKESETLKTFMGRFNNETLEVQDLRIDMMVSILIYGLKKGPLASALADPLVDVEQLMGLAQKYIDEEKMNAIKDGEWRFSTDHERDRDRQRREGDRRLKSDKRREPLTNQNTIITLH
ncbi:UNVERIFIED_CONTAM: hypothetical protein Sindi_1259300 [Sesamum indicum]